MSDSILIIFFCISWIDEREGKLCYYLIIFCIKYIYMFYLEKLLIMYKRILI